MSTPIEPLVNDGFASEPATKRTLAYLQSRREQGHHVVGTYCGYAPMEVIRAMGAVPSVLCAFSETTIEAAEAVLPANLCPLIKSSYGYIVTDTCPFFGLSEAVIAETTCDGKKKMFELISHTRPMHVMDLPQLPEENEAKDNWTVMIRKLKGFLEKTFNCTIQDEDVETQIRDTNRKNRMMDKVFEFATIKPLPINWKEIYDLTWLALSADADHMEPIIEDAVRKLEKRVREGVFFGRPDSPRVLVTGCPVGGDAAKVFKIIEEAGGVVVCLDACTGMKAFLSGIEEGTPDPYRAISERYLKIPCSCMTPNTGRLDAMDRLITRFRPDVIVDVVLQACHSYNIESHKVKNHAKSRHNLPCLKIETDYSQADVERIRTRVEAVFDSL